MQAAAAFRSEVHRQGRLNAVHTDLRALVLLWGVGLIALAFSALVGALPCPFERLTGLSCPFCGATTAIRYLLDGEWHAALNSHATAALIAPMSLVAMLLLAAWALLAPQRSTGDLYARMRITALAGIAVLLMLQWCWTVALAVLAG